MSEADASAPTAAWVCAEFAVADYDLAATLGGGQAFRWTPCDGGWEGVVAGRWIRLEASPGGLRATARADTSADWRWLREYLRLDEDLSGILASFPADAPMQAATAACRGLRVLRQEPWECLASFICSSTKQIPQIQQCIARMAERLGEPAPAPPHRPPHHGFPSAAKIAAAGVERLRECKLGYRAAYLHASACAVAEGRLALDRLAGLTTMEARRALMELPGVGPKVADCVLLFAYGRQDAFPVDVWVQEALRRFYFPRRRPDPKRLQRFAARHFGPNAGYAQQYLFHYARLLASGAGRRPLTRALGAVAPAPAEARANPSHRARPTAPTAPPKA